MQAHVHKKEGAEVVKCPRCHAENIAVQKKCGKCGYVFPKAVAKKKDEKAPFEPPLSPVSPASQSPFGEIGQQNGEGGEGGEQAPEEIPVPKNLIGKGKSEGIISKGEWRQCPRCGADLGTEMKRCSKCGMRIK